MEEHTLEINDIIGTPFKAVKFDTEGNINLVVGNVRLETSCKDINEINDWMMENHWDCIALLCQATTHNIINNKK